MVSQEVVFNLETQTPVPVKISIYASTGGLVYKNEMQGSAFMPIALNVRSFAPGRYTAVLDYEGVSHRVRFVKY